MAKPLYSIQDTDILSAFDQRPICTITNVVEHLNGEHKYQAVRRGILRLVKRGLLMEVKGTKEYNQKFYAKTLFNSSARFMDYSGNSVSLKGFIYDVVKLGETEESKLIGQMLNPAALAAIKHWLLSSLSACDPEAYTSKNLTPPNQQELARKLHGVLEMLSALHAYIKTFTLTSVDNEKLAAEFKSVALEEFTSIVDRTWDDTSK